MISRCTHGAVAGILLGIASIAHAQVMKVEVSPSPALTGHPATVTVTGSAGPCGAVQINYGDGTVITYPIETLPMAQSHAWNTPGDKIVTATGQGNCRGQASVIVTVNKRGIATTKPDPSDPRMFVMRIKSYFGLSEPGGFAAIAGENFGAQRGTVIAKLRGWDGSLRDVPLMVNDWSPTLLELRWPTNIQGVVDQMDVPVVVTNETRTHTATWKVFFRAEMDYQVLPMSAVKVLMCDNSGNKNFCNSVTPVGAAGDCPFDPYMTKCNGTFGAAHYNCYGAIGDDHGTDAFAISLANGWSISSVKFLKDAGGGAVANPSVATGSSKWNPQVKWSVTPADTISYCAHVHITGPKGVPY